MNKQRPKTFLLRDDGTFPNHPRWPLLIYRNAFLPAFDDPAGVVERLFRGNDWCETWRNGIYNFPHYHSNAHEVLGVFSGNARVQFGGPKGETIELSASDVAILPAGTAHQNLGSSADFGVVGAYPPGPAHDLCRGTKEEYQLALAKIARVARPETDPIFGTSGGLGKLWPA